MLRAGLLQHAYLQWGPKWKDITANKLDEWIGFKGSGKIKTQEWKERLLNLLPNNGPLRRSRYANHLIELLERLSRPPVPDVAPDWDRGFALGFDPEEQALVWDESHREFKWNPKTGWNALFTLKDCNEHLGAEDVAHKADLFYDSTQVDDNALSKEVLERQRIESPQAVQFVLMLYQKAVMARNNVVFLPATSAGVDLKRADQ